MCFFTHSSNELSTPVADCVYVNKYIRKRFLCLRENDDSSRVKYPTEVKIAGVRSESEEFHVSSQTEDRGYHSLIKLLNKNPVSN